MIILDDWKTYIGKDGRVRAYNKKLKLCKSYPRVLMELKIGRPLEPYEQVHHIDENPLNNDLDNLEIALSGEHQRYHFTKYKENIISKCVYCGKEIVLTPIQQRNITREAKRGKKVHFVQEFVAGNMAKKNSLEEIL